MTKIIEGYIRDSKDQVVSDVDVQVFKKMSPFNLFWDVTMDLVLIPIPEKTDNKGYFKIMLSHDFTPHDSLYICVTDS